MMEINTIFQLAAMNDAGDPKLKIGKHLLFMPDLFNYFLTGEVKNEYTIASTSSLLNAATKNWSSQLIKKSGLNEDIFCDIIKPGACIGKLKKEVCSELACAPINIIAVGSHDTASAAAVTFRQESGTAFLSSGTWSLLGMFIDQPVLNEDALKLNITNEGGLNDKILFLKNITGLWLLENLMKEFEKNDVSVTYEVLLEEASVSKNLNIIIDPDDKLFQAQNSISDVINNYCLVKNIHPPKTRGEFVRIVLESLANKYKEAVRNLEDCTGEKIECIHIVGGGSKNDLLCQLTADITGRKIIAGPVEATAIGNIIIQAIANREISDFDNAFKVIQKSFDVKHYHPQIKS